LGTIEAGLFGALVGAGLGSVNGSFGGLVAGGSLVLGGAPGDLTVVVFVLSFNLLTPCLLITVRAADLLEAPWILAGSIAATAVMHRTRKIIVFLHIMVSKYLS